MRRQRCKAASYRPYATSPALRKPQTATAKRSMRSPYANYRCKQALRSRCRYHLHRSMRGMLALPAPRAGKASRRNRPINPRSANNRS